MKQYYYSDGYNQYGPFTIEELSKHNITKDTLVWFKGLSKWLPAHNFSELNDILIQIAPPVTTRGPRIYNHMSNVNQGYNIQKQHPPKTWLVESILATLFCCLPFGIVGIVNASKVESRFYAGDIYGAIRASEEAGRWTKIGFWIGLVLAIITIAL